MVARTLGSVFDPLVAIFGTFGVFWEPFWESCLLT